MDYIAAYREVGTFRGAADMCGTTHKTVGRAVHRQENGGQSPSRPERRRNYDIVKDLVTARMNSTKGKISAKRLLPQATKAGYSGSARNFRRLVAKARTDYRNSQHHGRRPAVWAPGEYLVIDWGAEGSLHQFCAVAAWSHFRFVRYAADERSETTLGLLAECFEELGAVPKVVLSDRMGCLKGAVVAGVVVPTPAYVRFATHYGFRPDFCEAADPESKGIVENLVGYAKRDLMIPEELSAADIETANARALLWCQEVNARQHSEIMAVPTERLDEERALMSPLPSLRLRIGRMTTRKVDRLSCVRIGSARYSVPVRLVGRSVEVQVTGNRVKVIDCDEVVADHQVVAPGESSINDDHYGKPRSAPARSVRPKTSSEKQFCSLGPVAEAFIKGAASAGASNLAAELEELAGLQAAHGKDELVGALDRAVAFGRWKAADVRSILAAGAGVPTPTQPGQLLGKELPSVPTRSLSDYAVEKA
jgi:hypothetical protein